METRTNNFDIENGLINSVASEALGMIPDYAEIGLDALLDDGLIKDLPIVGTLLKIVEIGRSVRDRLFLKKIIFFLQELKKVPLSDRINFLDKLNQDASAKQKTGEMLVLILERLDDMDKPSMVAKVFSAYIMGDIDLPTMKKLVMIVDRATIADIKGSTDSGGDISRLVGLGLYNIVGIGGYEHDPDSENIKKLDWREIPHLFQYSESKESRLLHQILSRNFSVKKKIESSNK